MKEGSGTRASAASGCFCALAILWLCVPLGCARNVIRAGQLPQAYQAPPVTDIQSLDLSRLAGNTVSSELIERGDVLQVTVGSGVANDETVSVPLRVSEDGVANVPLVGRIPVAGLELEGCEQAIRAAAIENNIFRNPQVTVTMKQKRFNRVTVVGAVNKPGVYEISRSSSNLLSALVAAGGLAKDAGKGIEIRRGQPAMSPGTPNVPGASGDRTADEEGRGGTPAHLAGFRPPAAQLIPTQNIHVDLAAAAHSGQSGVNVRDGDVVMVMKQTTQPVHVIGLVAKPGQFQHPTNQQLHVLDAIAMAGGLSSQVADKVFVIRHVPDQPEPVVIQVSVREAKTSGQENLALAPGDVVSVEQTPATVMVDALKNFVRFGVSAAAPVF
jgi:polysaccharide export outer membrane protein